jgi:uncharacterized membrane protein YeaQ/YmgE (transglycosylase-associated protein family)
MTLLGFVVLVVIAAITGAIGQAIVGRSIGGCLISSVIGFVGAVIGMWLSRELGMPELLTINIQGQPFPIIWSIIGAALLTAILAMIGRRRLI